jgi:hypothetical protein
MQHIIPTTPAFPVPIVTVLTGRTHGRLVDSEQRPEVVTWCGRRLAVSTDVTSRDASPGVADKVAAVSCGCCRRSRPASWAWPAPRNT